MIVFMALNMIVNIVVLLIGVGKKIRMIWRKYEPVLKPCKDKF